LGTFGIFFPDANSTKLGKKCQFFYITKLLIKNLAWDSRIFYKCELFMFAMLSSSVAVAQQGFPPEQQWV
jgi:hypothetical protein